MRKTRENNYAKAFIILQEYENLLKPETALLIGTIFKDLYSPYDKRNKKY